MPANSANRNTTEPRPGTQLLDLAAHGFLVAKDTVSNAREFILESSRMALITVRQCERELDLIERQIDERMPQAMIQVGEKTARELMAVLRFVTDLERIADLLLWTCERSTVHALPERDKAILVKMLTILEHMLQKAHDGLRQRDLEIARSVLRDDRLLDRLRYDTFKRHLQGSPCKSRAQSVDVLFMVQSIERAGDHVTNLAEELVHLIERRSIRHTKATHVET